MKFEAELWPNSSKMTMVNISLASVCIISIIGIVLANMFWDDYMTVMQTLDGRTRNVGWPSTVQSWAIGFLVFTPPAWAMMFFGQDRKQPALAANKEGLFINQQLVKATFVPWKQIKEVTATQTEMTVEFGYPDQVINAQKFPYKPFVKANVSQAGNSMSFENEGNPEAFEQIVELALRK